MENPRNGRKKGKGQGVVEVIGQKEAKNPAREYAESSVEKESPSPVAHGLGKKQGGGGKNKESPGPKKPTRHLRIPRCSYEGGEKSQEGTGNEARFVQMGRILIQGSQSPLRPPGIFPQILPVSHIRPTIG